MSMCKAYESLLFVWLSFLVKTLIHYCLLLDSSCRIQKELRKS